MKHPIQLRDRPGLLVSVRDAREAQAALHGGAQVIDVKEPERGPLGAADMGTIAAVAHAVDGRVPVTAALGELRDLVGAKLEPIPAGVLLFKIGLAGCSAVPNWSARWRDAIDGLTARALHDGQGDARPASPTAVVYADWRAAAAPSPHEVLDAAVAAGCLALLIDTWDKSSGSLFDLWPAPQLGPFLEFARAQGLMVVLAGSLVDETLLLAASLMPDLVGVRAAACQGGRRGSVSAERVRHLQQALRNRQPKQTCHTAVNRNADGAPGRHAERASDPFESRLHSGQRDW